MSGAAGATEKGDCAESLCTRCAWQGPTCCQGTRVFLTQGDLDRIAGQVKHYDFYEYIPMDWDDRSPDDVMWSNAAGNDRIRVLRHKREEAGDDARDCLFLGGNGCRLALEVRPLICRLYPFEYNHETIHGVTPHLCPAPERDNHPLLLASLCMNREQAEEWRQTLYQEIAREFPPRLQAESKGVHEPKC